MTKKRKDLVSILRDIPPSRRIYVERWLDEARVNRLSSRLGGLSPRDDKPMRLDFNCRGGFYESSLRLHGAIKGCERTTYGVAGIAYSGALIALMACDVVFGKSDSLYCAKYNELDLGKVGLIRARPHMDTVAVKKFLDEVVEPYVRESWQPAQAILLPRVERRGKTAEELHELLCDERVMSVKEAYEWGFVDVILN